MFILRCRYRTGDKPKKNLQCNTIFKKKNSSASYGGSRTGTGTVPSIIHLRLSRNVNRWWYHYKNTTVCRTEIFFFNTETDIFSFKWSAFTINTDTKLHTYVSTEILSWLQIHLIRKIYLTNFADISLTFLWYSYHWLFWLFFRKYTFLISIYHIRTYI